MIIKIKCIELLALELVFKNYRKILLAVDRLLRPLIDFFYPYMKIFNSSARLMKELNG